MDNLRVCLFQWIINLPMLSNAKAIFKEEQQWHYFGGENKGFRTFPFRYSSKNERNRDHWSLNSLTSRRQSSTLVMGSPLFRIICKITYREGLQATAKRFSDDIGIKFALNN